ncbi:MAG: very short patch repair endonuclease [Betaproteobacteria bacterium]
MVDTVTKETRSNIMARIRSMNTRPEMLLRKALFALGLRYRLHFGKLPGCPDLVFPKYKVVAFVHGCFWHWHGCERSRMPKTNVGYWRAKIARNQARDSKNVAALCALGWRVLIVWECALKAPILSASANEAADWIRVGAQNVGTVAPTIDN